MFTLTVLTAVHDYLETDSQATVYYSRVTLLNVKFASAFAAAKRHVITDVAQAAT